MSTTIPAGSRLLAPDLLAITALVDAAPVTVARVKSADTSRTNNTYTSDPHLTCPVVASGTYAIDLYAVVQAGATGSFKQQWTFPSGTMEAGSTDYDPGADDWQTVAPSASPGGANAGFTGTGANWPFRFRGTVFIGATGGTLAWQWAQNTTNATATIVRKGSRMIVMKLS